MDSLNISNKVKYFLIFAVSAPFIGLFGWVFLNMLLDNRNAGEIFLDSRTKIHCEGKVQKIYRQEMNNNILTLKTKNCEFQVEAVWETLFKIGDSISKKEGEVIVEHYRDGKLLEILDYRDLAKNRKNIKDSFFPLWKKNK